MPNRALIFGINGFAASHLAELLLREGWHVSGTKRVRSRLENIEHIVEDIDLYICELTDAFAVREIIKKVNPDVVFHLAAQSFVPLSWKAPHLTFETNVQGTINVLEACRELDKQPIIHISSSSQVYGNAELPFSRDTLLDPQNPYDVSKLAQEMIARVYWKSYGMRVRLTRAFNITGPRRQEFMADSSFARQVALCEAGKQEEIVVGNLEATRDFVDIRDVVEGYLRVIQEGEDGKVYLLCSGVERSMREVLDTLIGLSTVKPKVVVDPNLLRPSDTPRMRGNISDVPENWIPRIPFKQSMSDLLFFWREKV